LVAELAKKLNIHLSFTSASKRIATITAIEFCEIYILDYPSFKKYVQTNEAIMQKLTETANFRMRMTLEAEEEHKKQLHEKIARETFVA
jgi:CRP-like cAMP-binding protein